jgi:hypothetical protein
LKKAHAHSRSRFCLKPLSALKKNTLTPVRVSALDPQSECGAVIRIGENGKKYNYDFYHAPWFVEYLRSV